MRAYRISCAIDDGEHVQFGGSQTEARQVRQAMVDKHGVKKSEVAMTEIDIPTGKAGLIEFINGQLEL